MIRFKAALALVLALIFAGQALACTTIIVGSEVSEDGRRYFGRTDDAHGLVGIRIYPLRRRTAKEHGNIRMKATDLSANCP